MFNRIYGLFYQEEKTSEVVKTRPQEKKQEFANKETLKLLPEFLEDVAKGNQDAAEKMLQSTPDLLLYKGEFSDYSEREFNTTALKFVFWSKDSHMREMLLKYISEDNVIIQLEEFNAAGGIQITSRDRHGNMSVKTEKSYDVNKLIDAIGGYNTTYNYHRADPDDIVGLLFKIPEANAFLSAVSRLKFELHQVPVHVANEFYSHKAKEEEAKQDFHEARPALPFAFLNEKPGFHPVSLSEKLSRDSSKSYDKWSTFNDRTNGINYTQVLYLRELATSLAFLFRIRNHEHELFSQRFLKPSEDQKKLAEEHEKYNNNFTFSKATYLGNRSDGQIRSEIANLLPSDVKAKANICKRIFGY